jgi:hypothetical protein
MRKELSAIFVAVVLIESSFAVCFAGNQAVLLRVMPVSSWGPVQTDVQECHAVGARASNNSAKQIDWTALAASKDFERTINFFNFATKQLSKEGGKRLGESRLWLASLFKSKPPAHVIAPAAPISTVNRISHAQAVSGKHPLWLLPNGRLKSVTLR